MKILLTGGHLTPAYAFAEIAAKHGDQVSLIGSAGQNSSEAKELSELGVTYSTLKSVKYNRYKKLLSIVNFPLITRSIWGAIRLLKQDKPDVVVTFGSYNAVPVAVAAKIIGVPVVTHEQTKSIGLANKLIAPFAAACAVSYQSSLSVFPKNKTTIIGNLLRNAVWNPPKDSHLPLTNNLPILYVTGGNQGSETVIKAVLSIIAPLSQQYQVILQHGNINPFLSDQIVPLVIAKSWFNTETAAWLLHHAHIVISRGGANTTSELMVAGVPSIIIPLQGSADNEQTQNAAIFADKKAGILIPQQLCSGDVLLKSIELIESDYNEYHQHAKKLVELQYKDAASSLYQIVKAVSAPV